MDDIIERTWTELGKRVRPLRNYVWVRTEPRPTHIGSILLPRSLQRFYADLPHTVLILAKVIAIGPEVLDVKVGDRIAFVRLYFARYEELEDKTLVGYIYEPNIAGYAVETETEAKSAAA